MAVPQTQKKRQKRQKKQDGFDCEFTEQPQEQFQAFCPICLLVLREPHQVTCCGYNFCRSCIECVQLRMSACPTCNRTDFAVFLNKGLKRSLYAFKVRCSHEKDGCQWTGQLGALDKHLNTDPRLQEPFVGCEFVDVECCFCYGHFKRRCIFAHQIKECTQRPYMLSLLTRYIHHQVQKSERDAQEREERIRENGQISRKGQAQLFSTKDELKHEVRTLELYCRDQVQTVEKYSRDGVRTLEQRYSESQAKLADQQKSTKLLWWCLVAMMVMLIAVAGFTGLAWNNEPQKRELIVRLGHDNDQLEYKEIVLREEFEVMEQQLSQKMEAEQARATQNRQGIRQLKDKHDLVMKEIEMLKQVLNQKQHDGSVQKSEGFLYYAIIRPLVWLVCNVLSWLVCCAVVVSLGRLFKTGPKKD